MERGQKNPEGQRPDRSPIPSAVTATATTALVDERPASVAQRHMLASIAHSPKAAAQQSRNAAIDGSAQHVAQRQNLQRLFGDAALVDVGDAGGAVLQGHFASVPGPVQLRTLTLMEAQTVVQDKKTAILNGVAVAATAAAFANLQQHWPARVPVEVGLGGPVALWTQLRTQLDTDSVNAVVLESEDLGRNVSALVRLGEQLKAVAPLALTAIQPACRALVAANNQAPLADLILLLGDTCGALDPAIAEAATLGLLHGAAAGTARALVIRACNLAANNPAQAAVAALFFTAYTADAKADKVSGTVLAQAAFDPIAAALHMTALVTWGYDLALEAWSAQQSDTLAQGDVDKVKGDAQTEKARLQSDLPADQGAKPVRTINRNPKKNEKKADYDARVLDWTTESGKRATGLLAIDAEDQKILGADALKPGFKQDRQTGMTDFMTAWTARLGVEQAGWTLKLAGGLDAVATALGALQTSPSLTALDRKDWATWAHGVAPSAAGIAALCATVERAVTAGCAADAARALAAWQFTTARLGVSALQKVVESLVKSPAERVAMLDFVTRNAHAEAATNALHRAVTVGEEDVAALNDFVTAKGLDNANWGLSKGDATIADGEKLLDLSEETEVPQKLLGPLREQSDDTDQLGDLLKQVDYDKPNPARLKKMLVFATTAQITAIIKTPSTGVGAAKLDAWLALGYVAADLVTLMTLTTGIKLEGIVNNNKESPTAVLAAYNQLNAAGGGDFNQLATLASTWCSKAKLAVIVGAHLSRASWQSGSFGTAIESIIYHHNKHGGALTVEQYTAAAGVTWGVGAQFNYTDSKGRVCRKITGPPGGKYTPGGSIYTYWT